YRASDLVGDRDNIEDFSIAEGDKVDLSEVASFYGWTAGELMDRLSFRDTSGGDLQLKIDLPSGTTSFALVRNMDANSFLAAGSIILDSGPPPGRLFLGSTGDDVLTGGAGNDLLEGDEGIDTLDGLAGSDTFIFARGALDGATDVINGFDASSEGDRVDISFLTTGYGWSEAEARSYTSLTEHAEGVYLSIDAPEFQSTLADFRGISAAGITFDDIVFV
ncbi:type I secretion C-terminal target domain-containing protein, partial [Sulfitobacter aestuarii]